MYTFVHRRICYVVLDLLCNIGIFNFLEGNVSNFNFDVMWMIGVRVVFSLLLSSFTDKFLVSASVSVVNLVLFNFHLATWKMCSQQPINISNCCGAIYIYIRKLDYSWKVRFSESFPYYYCWDRFGWNISEDFDIAAIKCVMIFVLADCVLCIVGAKMLRSAIESCVFGSLFKYFRWCWEIQR